MPSLLSLAAALATATLALAQSVPAGDCPAFHIIVARASTETNKSTPYGGPRIGYIGHVVNATCSQIDNCTSYGIAYPAIADGNIQHYNFSESLGIQSMREAIVDFHTSCPKTPIALMGHSQGGQVIADTLCGRSEAKWFGNTPPLTGPASKMIIATILMGDPSFVQAEAAWYIGNTTAKEQGIFPRTNLTGCQPFVPGMRTYCDDGDPYCAAPSPETAAGKLVHNGYVTKYGTIATKWVVYRYNQFKAGKIGSTDDV